MALFGSIAAPLIGSVVGGLLNQGGGGQSTQTSSQKLDPRAQQSMYKALGGADALYDNQMAYGGINPLMNAGMTAQLNALTDPAFSQGYGAMRSAGLGLMGQGAAGNPFSSGQASLTRPTMGGAYGGIPQFRQTQDQPPPPAGYGMGGPQRLQNNAHGGTPSYLPAVDWGSLMQAGMFKMPSAGQGGANQGGSPGGSQQDPGANPWDQIVNRSTGY